jgi:hypothetical protein
VPVDVETHRELARSLNAAVWDALGSDRDPERDAALPDLAHASLHHWRVAGGPVEVARGEWLVSRVYAVLGRAEPALHHARRSYEICVAEGFGGFDLAYAYEGVARALATAGRTGPTGATGAAGPDAAQTPELRPYGGVAAWRARATAAGEAIPDDEDRAIFTADLAAEPWWGS